MTEASVISISRGSKVATSGVRRTALRVRILMLGANTIEAFMRHLGLKSLVFATFYGCKFWTHAQWE